jgi:hypothetical protein
MTPLTLRYTEGAYIVTGKDFVERAFVTRREARDWCQMNYPGSPIREVRRSSRAKRKPPGGPWRGK